MSLFNFHYPYTDFHELNLDWILEQMKSNLLEIEEALNKAVEISKQYTDEQTKILQEEFNKTIKEIKTLQSELSEQYTNFTNLVNAQIQFIDNDVKTLSVKIDDEISGANAYTNQAIENNNEYLIETLSKNIQNFKVVNFFNGALVTVQEMFDTLAMLHIDDPMSYDMLASKNETYNNLVSLRISYTELVQKGNALIPQN